MTVLDRPRTTAGASDRPAKIARLLEILDAHDAPAIALASVESLAWLLDGARVTVPTGGAPVLNAVVDRAGGVVVTTFANEAERLRDEELGDGVDVRAVPWHAALPGPGPGVLPEAVVVEELRTARAALLPAERARYAELGAETAAAVSTVLRAVRPETTERALAADLASVVVELGAEPVVLLAAGRSRSGYRHPLPTTAPLGSRAMAVVGARRHGLIVNLTRWVSIGEPAPEGEVRLLEVEADAFAATRPGRELGDVLADIAASYERHGFGADAWLGHHQGGPTGYVGRDPRATPDAPQRVVDGQAFAWNPTAPGLKVEDTVVVDGGELDVLTLDPAWPTRLVRGRPRPVTLEIG